MKKKRRLIVVKEHQFIACGDFGSVYRISKDKVVKVFDCGDSKEILENLATDELRGSKLIKHALPVLERVNVLCLDGKIRPGLIKEYLPYDINYQEFYRFIKKNNIKTWDAKAINYRKDSKGKIWRVDTQTQDIWRIIDRVN